VQPRTGRQRPRIPLEGFTQVDAGNLLVTGWLDPSFSTSGTSKGQAFSVACIAACCSALSKPGC